MKPHGSESAALPRRKFLKLTSAAGAGLGLLSRPAAARGLFGSRDPLVFPREHRRVIIIGSGFGGAITAHRLTERGIPVLLLERGKRWESKPGAFSSYLLPDGRAAWLSNTTVVPLGPPIPVEKRAGLLDNARLGGLSLMNAACYGGGSVVYGGALVEPDPRLFNQVFTGILAHDELKPHYESVGGMLGRSTMPDDVFEAPCYEHIRVMKSHCDKAGIATAPIETGTKWDTVRAEINGTIPPSITHGEAIYGVSSGAKVTLDRTYLALAEQTGLLEVKTLHQVTGVSEGDQDSFVVTVEEIDDGGTVTALKSFTCDYLFLTAGTVGTAKLMVRAKARGDLSRLSDEVGQGFGNNGNCYALRLGLPEGVGSWQGGPPALGITDFENEDTPLFIEHPQLPLGFDFHGLMYFSIGINKTRGRFVYNSQSDTVDLEWPKGDDNGQAKVNKALLRVMDKLNTAAGGFTATLLSDDLRTPYKDTTCYHPLGGMVLGKAVDLHGRVKGYSRLYVNDGAMMPGSAACANPALTISALAERNIAHILEHDF